MRQDKIRQGHGHGLMTLLANGLMTLLDFTVIKQTIRYKIFYNPGCTKKLIIYCTNLYSKRNNTRPDKTRQDKTMIQYKQTQNKTKPKDKAKDKDQKQRQS
jgi:hypothetical protein